MSPEVEKAIKKVLQAKKALTRATREFDAHQKISRVAHERFLSAETLFENARREMMKAIDLEP
jgi:hypothetical protein